MKYHNILSHQVTKMVIIAQRELDIQPLIFFHCKIDLFKHQYAKMYPFFRTHVY